MTNLYTNDHSRNTSYLRKYDPIKQFFCLPPYNDKSRLIVVLQENLVHFDDSLLPCNIPTTIVKTLTVIQHLVSSPLKDKDKFYYTALSKQSHSYTELLFISAKIISYMVQTENNADHKPSLIETKPPHRNKTHLIGLSSLSHISYTVMTERTNSYKTLA